MTSIRHATDKVVVQSIFKKYDGDNSNCINSRELGNLIQDLGAKITSNCTEALRLVIDKNEDGKVSFEEFYNWWIRLGGKNEQDFFSHLQHNEDLLEQAYLMFKKYDKSGNNSLGIDEFKLMYQDLYRLTNIPMGQVENALKALDSDNSGSIGFVEFIKWLNWFSL